MKKYLCSIGEIEIEAQDEDEAIEFAIEAFNRRVNKEYMNNCLTVDEIEQEMCDKFTKITTGFVTQTFTRNPNGKLVCTSQEFVAGDQCDYEDDEGNPIKPSEYSYQPYNMHL